MARTEPAPKREGRRPLIAGNWKMHLSHLEAIGLVPKLVFSLPELFFQNIRKGSFAYVGFDTQQGRPP